MYALEPQEWMQSNAADTQLYQLISIDGDRLHYAAHNATGDLNDEFELRKQPTGYNEIVERDVLEKQRLPAKPSREQLIMAVAALLALAAFFLALKGLRWWSMRKKKPAQSAK
jgi:hypothetical protein